MVELGCIFHFGPYSYPAYDDIKSARRRKIQNGSEWYYKRLMDENTYRPTSGAKETKTWHYEYYPDKTYDDFSRCLTGEFFEEIVEIWIEKALSIGATYLILTTKHHDGYCLWNTSTLKKVPFDYVEVFVRHVRAHHLKVGFYYSWMEFGVSFTKNYINQVVRPQIDELKQYNPDIWWFDGDWEAKSKYAIEFIHDTTLQLRNLNNKVEINDRTKDSPHSTYYNYADRYIPDQLIDNAEHHRCAKHINDWEHINTIGISWGYNCTQEHQDYKTGQELYDLYQLVKRRGGKFLLNIGPEYDGKLDPTEELSLNQLANLIRSNS